MIDNKTNNDIHNNNTNEIVRFKSRSKKKLNIRTTTTSSLIEDNNDEEEGSGSNTIQNAKELRLEQQMRKRKMGIDPIDSNVHNDNINNHKNEVNEKDMNKFKSNVDSSISLADGIIHEKIMEKYIEEKLGLKYESDIIKEIKCNVEDELYRVPDYLKQLSSKINEKVDDRSNESIGLISVAEVSLPSSYKLKNLEEMKEVRKQLSQIKENKYRKLSHSRFESNYDCTITDLDIDSLKTEKLESKQTVSNFAIRDEDKISYDVESSEYISK